MHTHAHDGQGQERRARRGRRPGAGRPGDRRGAGRRRGRPAGRQHRRPRRAQLVGLYGADPAEVVVGAPRRRPRPLQPWPVRGPGEARRRARPGRGRPGPAVRRADPAAQGARRAAASGRPCSSPTTRPCASGCVVAVVGGPTGSGLAHPTHLADLAARPRHRRPRPVRPAGGPDRARRLVPGGRPGRGAVVQRVVRPGRPRGAGLRHAGRRRRRRRPARPRSRDGRSGLLVDGHDPGPGPPRSATCSPHRRAASELAAGAVRHAARLRLGGDRRRRPRRLRRAPCRTTGDGSWRPAESARGDGRPVGRAGPADRRRAGRARARLPSTRTRARSSSACRAPTSCSPTPGSSSATTACSSRRSWSGTRTRTRPSSAAACSSATRGCTASHFAPTSSATSTWSDGVPLDAVTADELDRLLGCVLTYADESLRHAARAGLRRRRSGASGRGGSAGASRWPTCRRSPASPTTRQ